jgi:hypothetical protein
MCKADHPGQVGTAEFLGERLIRGFVDRFQPPHDMRTPPARRLDGCHPRGHCTLEREERPSFLKKKRRPPCGMQKTFVRCRGLATGTRRK